MSSPGLSLDRPCGFNIVVRALAVDPIDDLLHDHRELSELLIAVHDALSRIDGGRSKLDDELHEIIDGVESLRDALLDHFAREQEGLFPFLVARLPSERERTERLILEHDRIAEALTQLVHDLGRVSAESLPAWRAALQRFEELYASHTRSEVAFLTEVAASLSNDRAAAEQLRALLQA